MTTPTDSTPSVAEFADQRVLVTGGTKGMGAAIARRLAQAGATVAVTARSAPAESLPFAHFIAADLGTAAGAAQVVEAVNDRLGGLDILINNVGGSVAPAGGFRVLSDDDWLLALNTNLLAAVRLDRAFLPAMLERKRGVIIHISSIQRRLPLYDSTLAYAAAKAALTNYSKGLSQEVGPQGVRVNSIAPGFVETEAATAFIDQLATAAGEDRDTARQKVIRSIGGIPLGQPGRPQDIAEAVAFLASARAAYIHGTELVIDGGSLPTI